MLSEIQEFLGLCALASVVLAVAAGGASYRYQAVKTAVRLKRPALVRLHLGAALGLAGFAAFHALLAPRVHPLQQAGALALAIVFLIGLSFRWGRRHLPAAVRVKIALVVLAALLLPVGHWLVGEADEGERAARGGVPAVVLSAPPAPGA